MSPRARLGPRLSRFLLLQEQSIDRTRRADSSENPAAGFFTSTSGGWATISTALGFH